MAADITKADDDGHTHVERLRIWSPVGVKVAVRDGRGRGYNQGDQQRHHSHVHRLPDGPPVGVQVAVRGGAAADITKAANNGGTYEHACEKGPPVGARLFEVARPRTSPRRPTTAAPHVDRLLSGPPVGVRLFEVGAAADITRADNEGFTPMSNACEKGHLSAASGCSRWARPRYHQGEQQWLDSLGKNAFDEDHIPICHWLILNELSDPYPEADDDHVDQAIVERDVRPDKDPRLAWAQAAKPSASFFSTTVMGAFHPEGTASTTDLLRRTLIAKGNTASSAEAILFFHARRDPASATAANPPSGPRADAAALPGRCWSSLRTLGVLHERELRNAELADKLVGMGV